MLGAETLRGKHPVATVETILHICKQAEKVFDHEYHFEALMRVGKCHKLLQSILKGRQFAVNGECLHANVKRHATDDLHELAAGLSVSVSLLGCLLWARQQ